MAVEAFLKEYGEAITYIAFFGLFAVMAILEVIAPRRRRPPERRRRWPANFAVTVLNIVLLALLPVSGIAVAALAHERGWGLLNQAALPLWAAIAVTFVAHSLLSWAVHLAMHKVPLLWRVHRVHHLDTHIDVATTVRFHPLEILIQVVPGATMILLLGLPVAGLILYEILDAAMAVFTHGNVRLPQAVERAVKWVFVTPDMHRIHHSTWHKETDSNYGATFSWWDRLFGTYVEEPRAGHDGMTIGLNECQDPRANSLAFLLISPFRRSLKLPAAMGGAPREAVA